MKKETLIGVLKTVGVYGFLRKIRRICTGNSFAEFRQNRLLLQFYRKIIRPGDVCFDVGANLGSRTRIFLKAGARVVSIEPQEKCAAELARMFGHNTKVVLVKKALGASEGRAEISICEAAPTISTMSEKWKSEGRFSDEYTWSGTQPVEVTTLDHMISEYGMPHFCKIDVEGYELQVLEGLSQPIPVISFEFMTEFLDEANRCIRKLTSLADYRFNFTIAEHSEMMLPEWVDSGHLMSIINSADFGVNWGDIYAMCR